MTFIAKLSRKKQRHIVRLIFILLFLFKLSGCSAFIGPIPFGNPNEILEWVDAYSEDGSHLIRAQVWLHKTLDICIEKKDKECFARTYFSYGLFLKSKGFRKGHHLYGEQFEFKDSSVTFENRLMKAEEFFDKALALNPNNKDIYNRIVKARGN